MVALLEKLLGNGRLRRKNVGDSVHDLCSRLIRLTIPVSQEKVTGF